MPPPAPGPTAGPPVPWWARALRAWNACVFVAWIVGPFAAAGRPGWVAGWTHLGAVSAGLLARGLLVARRNPELRRHRRTVGPGTPRWDLCWNALFWPLMAFIAVTAGAQARRAGPTLPLGLSALGLVLLGVGLASSGWAAAVNPFFEGTVRIQPERGHRVVDAGPYRLMRHPGYLGLALWALASPLLLRSWLAFLPAAAAAAWVVLRTALEDALLRRDLPGYADYARRVGYRLVPGLW